MFAAAVGSALGRAIDLGCSSGACAFGLAKLGWSVVGIDGTGILDHPRRDAASRGFEVEFVHSTGEIDFALSPAVVGYLNATLRTGERSIFDLLGCRAN